jgi:DNA-binding NarL/FixJ family response regulator
MTSGHQLTNFKIFIVDDATMVVNRLKLMLSELKYVSVEGHASNISGALVAIKEKQPDAVLLDIHLKDDAPDASGIDLLITLRKEYPSLIIMMLTNHANHHYMNKCMELGADYFFDKSNDFDRISETVKKIQDYN